MDEVIIVPVNDCRSDKLGLTLQRIECINSMQQCKYLHIERQIYQTTTIFLQSSQIKPTLNGVVSVKRQIIIVLGSGTNHS